MRPGRKPYIIVWQLFTASNQADLTGAESALPLPVCRQACGRWPVWLHALHKLRRSASYI